jgi:hypothetical protein
LVRGDSLRISARKRCGAKPYHWKLLGDVKRGNKVPTLDTIVAMAKGLALPPSTLLFLEREEYLRNIRKHIDSLLTKCNPQQLEMVHRIIKVLLEP